MKTNSLGRGRHSVFRVGALSAMMAMAGAVVPAAWSADAVLPDPAVVPVAGHATYFADSSLQDIWKDLAAKQVINQRIIEGGHYSVNVRIVRPTDAPLVHVSSIDVWVVTAGTATAVTGGELVNPQRRPNSDDTAGTAIRNGTEQALKEGDIVFVPQGVAHGFKDLKGFRALLLRVETAGSATRP